MGIVQAVQGMCSQTNTMAQLFILFIRSYKSLSCPEMEEILYHAFPDVCLLYSSIDTPTRHKEIGYDPWSQLNCTDRQSLLIERLEALAWSNP